MIREAPRAQASNAGTAAVLGGIAAFIAIAVVAGSTGHAWLIIVGPMVGIIGLMIARAWITANTYTVIADGSPGAQFIGATFAWGVRIVAHRDVAIQAAKVTLRCQEHAIVSSGKSTAHYRRTLYERQYSLPSRQLRAGEDYVLRPELEIPASAIPSYEDHHHRIEWQVELNAPTEGFCANIRQKMSLRVAAKVAEAGHATDHHVPVEWLRAAPIIEGRPGRITPGGVVGSADRPLKGISAVGEGVMASLEVTDGVSSDHGPLLPAGATRELKLIVEAQEAIHCRHLLVWIGCHIGGRGAREEVVLFREEPVWQGDLAPGQPVEAPIRIVIPPDGPVTYQGEYVRYDWLVRVRVEVPVWRDRIIEIPFVVTPQAVQG